MKRLKLVDYNNIEDVEIDKDLIIDFDKLDEISENSEIKFQYIKHYLDEWLLLAKYNFCFGYAIVDNDATRMTLSDFEAYIAYELLVSSGVLVNRNKRKRQIAAEIANSES